ncbi:MAG: group II intron reverse transcriptase/maturase [Geobacteraceae bacterium]|nr:group II intron reverse transcriptase/maturase [Geobacteraceae bacterium]
MKRILHSAIDKVYNWNNLSDASHKVVQNKGSGGIDRMSVTTWAQKEKQHLSTLRHRLINDTYRSNPVKRCYIDKPGSKKKRPLGIPIVTDRVCQQAVHNVLSPVFEEYFHEDSYGFRPGRSTHMAAKRVEELRKQGYRTVVDLDIKGFFDHVDHEILMQLVRQVIKDRRVLGLIRGWLKAGVMEEGKIRYQTSGTPQGGVISPLLSNIYLTVLDNALTQAGYKFVRYADDVVILCRREEEAPEALNHVREVLKRLKLELSEEKTSISTFKAGFDFLGFHFTRRGHTIGTKSLKSLYAKVRLATRRKQGDQPVEEIIKALNPLLRGWGNYHRYGQNVGMFTKLDRWVRNRLRSYIYGRWRTIRWPRRSKPTKEEFDEMELFSMRSILRPEAQQLMLF